MTKTIWEMLHQTINVVQIRVLIGGLIHLFRISQWDISPRDFISEEFLCTL